MNPPLLWYLADPMSSWSWGLSPLIETLRDEYRERMKFALVVGGLRPGETAPMTATGREDILHHWHAVQARTGQPFRFDDALPEGIVYDPEPACRAVVTVGGIDSTQIFAMFKAIQSALYAKGRDVTQAGVLADLAAGLGVDGRTFLRDFDSDIAPARTQTQFRQAHQAGVRGFPTLIVQRDTQLHPVCSGCLLLDTVRTEIDRCLRADA